MTVESDEQGNWTRIHVTEKEPAASRAWIRNLIGGGNR